MSLYALSETLAAAVASDAPQRVLIEFFEKPFSDEQGEYPVYDPPVCFSNEDILISNGLQLTSEFNSETDLTIGLCPSAEIRFSMLNDEGQLEGFEFGTFRAYLGAKISSTGTDSDEPKRKLFPDGYYEFAPLGVFIAHRPDVVRKKIIDVDANDRMILLDEELPPDVVITWPKRLNELTQVLLTSANITGQLKTNTWLNSDISVAQQPEQFTGATMREILGWIAEAACANAMFDRDGKLTFVWFNQTNKVFDESGYTEFTPTWYETQPIDSLHIRNGDSTAENTYYPPETESGANPYMIQNNPFLRQPESP